MKTKFYLFVSFSLVFLLTPYLAKAAVDGALAYGVGTETTPKVRYWDSTAGSWSAQVNAANLGLGATINWIVVKAAPTRNEFIMVTRDANDDIIAQVNKSGCWGDGTTCGAVKVITTNTNPTPESRSFGVEYEGITGKAIIVFSDNTADPKYITWNGATWSTAAGIGETLLSGIIEWVELTNRPNTDEIVAVFSDANDDLNAIIWSGSWGCQPGSALVTNLPTTDYKKFDAAYEGSSGDLFIVSGISGTADLRRHTKPTGSCTYTTTTITGFAEIGYLLDVSESIPGIDTIIISEADVAAADHHTGAWSGTADRANGCADASMEAFAIARKETAAGYLGVSGREGIAVYADSNSRNIDWCTYNLGTNTWTTQTDVTPNPALQGDKANLELYKFPEENKIMLIFSDQASDLWAKTYDGTSWVNTESGVALNATLSTVNYQNFDFAFRRYLNRWLEVDWTTGSQINSTTCTVSQPCGFPQYSIFSANATVICKSDPPGSSCGSVNGVIRYNETSNLPNKPIGTKEGVTPFYVFEPRGTLLSWENVTDYSTGEDAARRFAADSQGNIIAVGWDYISLAFNWRVVKYSPMGSELWVNTSANARANGIAVDSQDNIIVVGYTSGAPTMWKVVKFNPSGSVLWDKIINYNGGGAWAVATDLQDNIIVGGLDNAPGNYEWHIVKYNSAGVMLWENVTNYGSTTGDEIFGVATDSQNNIIIGGFTSDTVGNSDQWRTMKYNSAGVMLWTNATDYSSGNDIIRDVEVDSQDNIIVVGNDVIPGNNEWRIVKFNSAGSVLWENVTDYTSNGDIAWGVGVDIKDNIIVAGIENSIVSGDSRMRVMKYNSAGSELWSNVVNPTAGDDQFYDATSDLEDSMILGGYDSLSGKEWRIMKYGSAGANPQSCGSMSHENICRLNWRINVTGNPGEAYRVDVNFSSNLNMWNDTNDAHIRISSLSTDTSFRITIPKGGIATVIISTDILSPTQTSANICFNASSNLPFPQSNINASNCQGTYQDETTPIIEFTNIGNVYVNFTFHLNQSLIPGVYIRCKNGTYNPLTALEIGTTPWLVDYNIPYSSPNNVKNVYCWLNITSAASPQELVREFRYRTLQA
jgi:uncharacterized delta-60 repeat protein